MAAPQSVKGPKSSGKVVAEMDFAKATPGTIQFKEPNGPSGKRPGIGTLYLTKEIISESGMGDFKRIRVTVEAIA